MRMCTRVHQLSHHRTAEAGREPWRAGAGPVQQQGHQQVAHGSVSSGFEKIQEWRLHKLWARCCSICPPWQKERVSLCSGGISRLLICPVSGHPWEEPGSTAFLPSHRVFVCTGRALWASSRLSSPRSLGFSPSWRCPSPLGTPRALPTKKWASCTPLPDSLSATLLMGCRKAYMWVQILPWYLTGGFIAL